MQNPIPCLASVRARVMQIDRCFAQVLKFSYNYITFFAVLFGVFPNHQVMSSFLVCLVFILLLVFPVISIDVISCSALNVLCLLPLSQKPLATSCRIKLRVLVVRNFITLFYDLNYCRCVSYNQLFVFYMPESPKYSIRPLGEVQYSLTWAIQVCAATKGCSFSALLIINTIWFLHSRLELNMFLEASFLSLSIRPSTNRPSSIEFTETASGEKQGMKLLVKSSQLLVIYSTLNNQKKKQIRSTRLTRWVRESPVSFLSRPRVE